MNPDKIMIERQGLALSFSQAICIDSLCGVMHGQQLPYRYSLTRSYDHPTDILVMVGTKHYQVSRGGNVVIR